MFIVEQVIKNMKFRDLCHIEVVTGGVEYGSQSGPPKVVFWIPLCSEGKKLLNIMLGRGNKQVVLTINFTNMLSRDWTLMKNTIFTYAHAARSHDDAMTKGRSLLDTFFFDSPDYLQECIEIVRVSFRVRPLKHILQTQSRDKGKEIKDKCIHAINQDYGLNTFKKRLDDFIDGTMMYTLIICKQTLSHYLPTFLFTPRTHCTSL